MADHYGLRVRLLQRIHFHRTMAPPHPLLGGVTSRASLLGCVMSSELLLTQPTASPLQVLGNRLELLQRKPKVICNLSRKSLRIRQVLGVPKALILQP
jgi:hypothetical protein